MLVLIVIKTNFFVKKQSCKKYLVRLNNTNNIRIVFILPTKIVQFYIRFFIIKIRKNNILFFFK